MRIKPALLLTVAIALLSIAPIVSQQKVAVFVGQFQGPDEFINERFRLLFMEELGKVKSVAVVNSKESAKFVIEGIGRVDTAQSTTVAGSATATNANISGESGTVINALLSVKVTERETDDLAFVGNTSAAPGFKGATANAVSQIMKDMKKKFKWK